MEYHFRESWPLSLAVLQPYPYGVMADVHIFGKTFFDAMDFLVSNLLMPFWALSPCSTFTGLSLKGSCNGRNYTLMKQHGNRDFSKSSFFPSSFYHSYHHQRGLYRLIYVNIKGTWEYLSSLFLFMDDWQSIPNLAPSQSPSFNITW